MEVKETARSEREFDVHIMESDVRIIYQALCQVYGVGAVRPTKKQKQMAKDVANELYASFPLDNWRWPEEER